jgi:hypothetical protein
MKLYRHWAAALCATVMACASNPTPVTVTGNPADRASLAGKWEGDYQSPATGRTGSIVFDLSPSGEAAHGDVVMIPAGYGKALERFSAGPTNIQSPAASQVLTIRLVQVADGGVNGVLDAYRDPQCDCPVETTFSGRLTGDTIEGTFTTRGTQIPAQSGTWRVKRTTR